MKFAVHDLKQVQRGSTVVVNLSGNAANVRLLDSANYNNFKRGKKHRIAGGGLVKRSPLRMVVPSTGHWYVTVDLMGMRRNARVKSSVAIEPPPLPVARSASPTPLSQVRVDRGLAAAALGDETWDVFISHANEDKAEVARPLAEELRRLGVKVWLDDFELRIGDNLRQKIDHGLARSSFGVVIFSKIFFTKGWSQYELDGIVTLTVAGEQNLLPIWHNITTAEVKAASPSLVGKVARSTATHTVEELALEIAERVRPDLFSEGHSWDLQQG